MGHLRPVPGLLLAAAWLSFVVAPAAYAGAPGSSRERGRRIYFESRGSGGEIVARLAGSEVDIPGEALLCADCHGRDGTGTLEGGVQAPDIRWSALSRPSRKAGVSARERPGYDRAALAASIVRGRDPAGHPLNVAMPVYRMAPSDLEDLLDYLEILGSERTPGVGPGEIAVGAVLPRSGRMAEAGSAVRDTIQAFSDAVNKGGGIHGRLLRPVFEDAAAEGGTAEAVRKLEESGVFCLLGSMPTGEEEFHDMEEDLRRRGLPLIGPVGLAAHVEVPPNPYVFHLLPGVAEQVRLLIGHALASSPVSMALAAADDGVSAEARRAFEHEMSLHGARPAQVVPIPPHDGQAEGVVEALRSTKPEWVVVVGTPRQVNTVASALRNADWRPRVLTLAALAGREILSLPPAAAEGIVLAYPGPLPEDAGKAYSAFTGFLGEAGVRSRYPAFQLTALAAAQVMVEGLKRAGRNLSREGFVAVLEKMSDFPTSLAPKVTFGPNDRTGIRATTLVRPDPAAGRFVPLAPPGGSTPPPPGVPDGGREEAGSGG